MADKATANENDVSREHLAELLNEDLAREYQAIIGYVVYSQVLSGAQYMDIAAPLLQQKEFNVTAAQIVPLEILEISERRRIILPS